MSSNIHQVELALLALSQEERAAVIQRGIDSLETTEKVSTRESEIDPAWTAEALRRLKQVKGNKVELLELKESHRHLRAELAARRREP